MGEGIVGFKLCFSNTNANMNALQMLKYKFGLDGPGGRVLGLHISNKIPSDSMLLVQQIDVRSVKDKRHISPLCEAQLFKQNFATLFCILKQNSLIR